MAAPEEVEVRGVVVGVGVVGSVGGAMLVYSLVPVKIRNENYKSQTESSQR